MDNAADWYEHGMGDRVKVWASAGIVLFALVASTWAPDRPEVSGGLPERVAEVPR
ncbi:hypothetical protein CLV43_12258 [Umezawaea tangerina]|uniref:Uncharacterized protein n=1 Tax=Umezawaea tangerina TaxID=84725 RepID=A0A2T0SE05_9PSEU|nr:hypothetical protein CLV43_12258 [Umezawaea tangerina]